MGNCLKKKGSGQKLTLAILGLDNAGKTVTTKGLQGESLDTVAPTVGYSSIDFTFEKCDVTMIDLGGGKKIRDIWKNYFAEIYGLVYVIDSSESSRMDECRGVLEKLLKDDKISGKPVLILANKQDKPGALDEFDICEQLDLEELVNTHKTPCRVELCAAIMGQGKKLDKSIKLGMRWLLSTIEKNHEILDERVKRDVSKQQERQKQERAEKAERVRKIREERKRKEREERRARGEPVDSESEEDGPPPNGDPFKRVDANDVGSKGKAGKEGNKRTKEAQLGRQSFDESRRPLSDEEKQTFRPRQLRSLDDSDIFPGGRKRQGMHDSPRPFRHPQYGLSRSRSPSPSREDGTQSHPWSRAPLGTSKLPPLGGGNDLSAPRRGVLAPLGTLEPLETLDKRSRKKKKKKAPRKNQTMPGGGGGEEAGGESGEDVVDTEGVAPRGWPTPSARASRSPRLDTVTEPDNETDAFAQKWGLVDELPELAEEDEEPTHTSSMRFRPNSDSYDVVT